MAFVQGLALVGRVIVHNVRLAVVVKEQRGVDAIESQFDGIAPTFEGVFGLHHHVADATGNLGGDHVKGFVGWVVDNLRGVDAGAYTTILHLQLRGTIQHMADGGPVHQILGMENGHPGEHSKGGTHQEIVITAPGDTGVGVTTLQDGVVKLPRFQGIFSEDLVIAGIDEVGEGRHVAVVGLRLVGGSCLAGNQAHVVDGTGSVALYRLESYPDVGFPLQHGSRYGVGHVDEAFAVPAVGDVFAHQFDIVHRDGERTATLFSPPVPDHQAEVLSAFGGELIAEETTALGVTPEVIHKIAGAGALRLDEVVGFRLLFTGNDPVEGTLLQFEGCFFSQGHRIQVALVSIGGQGHPIDGVAAVMNAVEGFQLQVVSVDQFEIGHREMQGLAGNGQEFLAQILDVVFDEDGGLVDG